MAENNSTTREAIISILTVDPIDELNHMVAWLHTISDMMAMAVEARAVDFSVNGLEGLCLILMHISKVIERASNEFYQQQQQTLQMIRPQETPAEG